MIRKRAGRIVSRTLPAAPPSSGTEGDFYIASCSSKTVVYKGLMLPERLDGFYLDLRLDATNLLNHTNFGAPNGTLSSSLFGKSQSLASGGFFGGSTAGNRSIFLQAVFNF